MPIDPYIARGIAPIGGDLPEIANMLYRRDTANQEMELRNRYQNTLEQRAGAAEQQQRSEQELMSRYAEMEAYAGDPSLRAQYIEVQKRQHPEFANTPFASMPPDQAFEAMRRGLQARLGKEDRQAQMGALYKLQDGTYQPADKAAGQPFYQEPERGYAPTEAPADQRLYQWYANLPPEQQQAFLNMKRSSATPEAAAAIASAKATGTEQAKAKVAAQGDLPRVEANASDMRGVLSQLKSHKGLRFILGGYSMAPAVPGTPQADALALWEQVQGKAFLEAFNSLKGGGQITEKEGEKATAAITRMSNRRQSLGGFMKAVKDLEEVVSAGEARARQKAGQGGSQRLRFDANGDPVQ
jgi:hypothetical protein